MMFDPRSTAEANHQTKFFSSTRNSLQETAARTPHILSRATHLSYDERYDQKTNNNTSTKQETLT